MTTFTPPAQHTQCLCRPCHITQSSYGILHTPADLPKLRDVCSLCRKATHLAMSRPVLQSLPSQSLRKKVQDAHHNTNTPDLARTGSQAASNLYAVLVHGILAQRKAVHTLWHLFHTITASGGTPVHIRPGFPIQ